MRHPIGASAARRQRGSFLVIGLVVALVVSLLLAGMVLNALSMSRSSQFAINQTQAFTLAEGVTESVQKDMITKLANFEKFALLGKVQIGSNSYPYTITPVGSAVKLTDTDGVFSTIQTYEIASPVEIDGSTATVRRIVDVSNTPIYQYMLFYDGDMEILPGPDMTLGGRVHCNGSIYVGSGATLTVNTNYFRATKEILRQRKNDGATTGGTVKIKVNGTSSYANFDPLYDSKHKDWLNLSNKTWKGTVQSAAHGVKAVAAPKVGSIRAVDPSTGSKGYYHANADLVIKDNLAYDRNGLPVLLPPGTVSEKTMYDAREGKNVTVTEINIGLLNTSLAFPKNGLLYAYRSDTTSTQPNGIRLTNGATLAGPLSVVTQAPVYIRGDFNTINKKGAAVIADAVNLLSNAWNDTKKAGVLPAATKTQYNLAFISGNVPTPDGGGSYSGGFENLPRFHENWSGVQAVILGSFVNLFQSQYAKAKWRSGGDSYSAPVRNWSFDPDLQVTTKMPPYTPNAITFSRILWDDGLPSPLGI